MKEEFWVLVSKRAKSDKSIIKSIMRSYDFITKFETEESAIEARDSGYGEKDDFAKKVTINIELGD